MIEEKKTPTVSIGLLVTIFLAAAIARILPSLHPAVWFDEIFSIYYVKKPLSDIWGADWRLDPTPPLYYTLLHFWSLAFGFTEWVLRALSLILSSLTACIIYFVGRDLRSHRAGVYAALAWVILPLSIDYGVEIRAYALEGLIMALAFWLAAILIRNLESDDVRRTGVLRIGGLLIFSGVLLTYTHITAIFPYGALILVVTALIWSRARGFFLAWFALNVAYVACIIPQVIATLAVMHGNAPTLAWLQPPSMLGLLGILTPLFIGEPEIKIASVIFILLWAPALGFCLWRIRSDRRSMMLLVVVPLVALGAFTAFSRFQPAILTRTVVWSLIPLSLLMGVGFASIESRGVRRTVAVAAGIIVALSSILHFRQREFARGDAAGIGQLASLWTPGSLLLLLDGEIGCEIEYYQKRLANHMRLTEQGPDREFVRTQRVELGCNAPETIHRQQILEEAAYGRRVWLVGRTPFYGNGARMRRDLDRLQASLGPSMKPNSIVETGSFIAVEMSSTLERRDDAQR